MQLRPAATYLMSTMFFFFPLPCLFFVLCSYEYIVSFITLRSTISELSIIYEMLLWPFSTHSHLFGVLCVLCMVVRARVRVEPFAFRDSSPTSLAHLHFIYSIKATRLASACRSTTTGLMKSYAFISSRTATIEHLLFAVDSVKRQDHS